MNHNQYLKYLHSHMLNSHCACVSVCNCTHSWLDLKVDGSELDGLGFGVADGGVEGMWADGRVEDGGLLAGCRRLVWSRFGQHRDWML